LLDTSENYSGTITVSAGNASAFDAIKYARDMLASMVYFDPKRAGSVEPVVKELDTVLDQVHKQEIQLTSKKLDWNEFEARLEEYRSLLDKNAEEPEFQTFFEHNPIFLEQKTTKAYPKFSLGGELIPDFLLVLLGYSYLFVEIEKPGVELFDKKGNPKAVLTHAQQQVRNSLKWVSENQGFLRQRECKELTGDNFRGLLVIGDSRKLSLGEASKLNNICAEVRDRYDIKTFDRVLLENEIILKNFKKYAK